MNNAPGNSRSVLQDNQLTERLRKPWICVLAARVAGRMSLRVDMAKLKYEFENQY